MGRKLNKAYPPYAGDEPYLHLSFCANDAARVEPLLAALSSRGVRVWYDAGEAADAAALRRRQERSNRADLLVAVLTRPSIDDRELKAAALFRQAKGMPLILFELDEADYSLAMGLNANVPRVRAWEKGGMREAAEELLRTDGFSYGLIGEAGPAQKDSDGAFGRLRTLVLLAITAAVVALGLAGVRLGWFSGQADATLGADDTLPITSPALIAGARDALGDGPLTPESAATVAVLRLSELPEDLSELSWFTGLERLEIPQGEAARAVELLDEAPYDIVLAAG